LKVNAVLRRWPNDTLAGKACSTLLVIIHYPLSSQLRELRITGGIRR
jgi:hypothetical protein